MTDSPLANLASEDTLLASTLAHPTLAFQLDLPPTTYPDELADSAANSSRSRHPHHLPTQTRKD